MSTSLPTDCYKTAIFCIVAFSIQIYSFDYHSIHRTIIALAVRKIIPCINILSQKILFTLAFSWFMCYTTVCKTFHKLVLPLPKLTPPFRLASNKSIRFSLDIGIISRFRNTIIPCGFSQPIRRKRCDSGILRLPAKSVIV